ncbi:2-hydroxychromene-2-carboxylate isomerase [Amorphus sp. 3PC139-8]|uniref:2-hydroxychromene-2-carboxylate isomerase n=1 Tax=Amorphus sp. 3PC139-8 TaxID=2735676 RepID=UPI00345CDFD1
MPETLDFYFDFMSPYAYLAYQKLPGLADEFGLRLMPKVIDLAGTKTAAGNTGPRNVDIPPKIRYLKVDLQRWAQRYGVDLIFPRSLESQRLNKGMFFASDRDMVSDYLDAAWSLAWASGADMSDAAVLANLARGLGWPEAEFLAFVDTADAAARYEASSLEAQNRGVFGVPIMMIGDEMWWGNDRLGFLRDFLLERI